MADSNTMIEQYMALALQPILQGAHKREDIIRNLDHIAELCRAAVMVKSVSGPEEVDHNND